jgi:hypothetical protein
MKIKIKLFKLNFLYSILKKLFNVKIINNSFTLFIHDTKYIFQKINKYSKFIKIKYYFINDFFSEYFGQL